MQKKKAIEHTQLLVLSLLGIIPYLGALFRVILFLFNIVYGLFLNLFYGIQHAAFYAELQDAASSLPRETTSSRLWSSTSVSRDSSPVFRKEK